QYSLCGNPDERGVWEVAVLTDSSSRGGSCWIHAHAKPGTVLRVRGPRNHLHLDESHTGHSVFVAGGIGITPIMAMARRARELDLSYELHYSGRDRSWSAFAEELAALHGERLELHISQEGRRNDFAALAGKLAGRPVQIYACGPGRMLDALQLAVESAGLPEGT